MIDIYPTLMDLTGLRSPGGLEGMSLKPWLKNPMAPRREPAITTYGLGNHAIRTEGWRYIRYSDGGEELYDRAKDPNEWTNLAANPELANTKAALAKWLPAHNEADAPRRTGGGGEDA